MRVLLGHVGARTLWDVSDTAAELDVAAMTLPANARLRVDCPAAELVDLLATRPSGWLRPFFVLATVEGDAPAARAPHHPWHRLGARTELGSAIQYALVWRPGAGERLFSRFRGVLAVEDVHPAALLSLEGECEGGDVEANTAVIAALLRLLATAVGAGYVPVG